MFLYIGMLSKVHLERNCGLASTANVLPDLTAYPRL